MITLYVFPISLTRTLLRRIQTTQMQVSTSFISDFSSVAYSSLPAARKFHELNQAYELLLDPLRRLALDAKLRLKQARTERYKSYDNKRKNMVEELEARERAFKKARADKQKEEVEKWHETERIKEEGRRLREDKEREMKKREEEQLRAAEEAKDDELDAPSLGRILSLVLII
jgi:DnaJ homolog subfamily C member 17